MIITFDLGTTRLKVAAFDLKGKLLGQVALRNSEYVVDDKRWQSADDWWQNCISGFTQLVAAAKLDRRQIEGFSLSGRAGAGVFLDGRLKVIHQPWSDNRHITKLRSIVEGQGDVALPLYAATLISKYLWLQENDADTAKRTSHLLYAKDFLLLRLTGEAITDPASGPDGDWPAQLLTRHNLSDSLLPTCQLPWTIAGRLTSEAAHSLQCAPGLPVAVGAHDGICANTGAGAIGEHQYAITLGTHAVVRAISTTWPEGSLRFYGYPENKHVIGGNALMAGRSLDWFVDNWYSEPEHRRQQIFADLDEDSGAVNPGSEGVRFLPFLSGQLAPERRPGATAAFHGLRHHSTRADMFRAVLEGSGFALSGVFNQVLSWVGEPVSIGVTGSGVNSRTWTQIIADILQRPLDITDASSEGRGAAMFCAVALGLYEDIEEATEVMVQRTNRVEPDPARKSIYEDILQEWQALADATAPLDKRRGGE
jgi:sugar (pentulose or hexulose) kinase